MRNVASKAWLAALVVGMCLVTACGGGGGDDETGGGNPPPNGSPPVTGEHQPGRLWHDNYALDYRDGTQIASANGAPLQVTAKLVARPWPDGNQYATADWNVYDDYTDVSIVETSNSQTRYRLNVDGYFRNIRPSPASKDVISAAWGEDSTSPADHVFVDLATMTVLTRIDAATGPVNWLPDGRFLLITPNGQVSVGQPGTPGLQPLGTLPLPAAHVVGDFWVNRQGTQMAVQLLTESGGSTESDLWVSGLDGSSFARLTQTKLSHIARWSPDGTRIAFDVDTGYFCNGVGCMGTCEVWHAAATDRNVRALPAVGDALRFRVKDRSGREQVLGCDLHGWTD